MARKHCRSRTRSRGKLILSPYTRMVALYAYTQASQRWMEWHHRTISLRQALQLVAAGDAEPVVRKRDGVVQVVGYRALKPVASERPSPSSLTRATMEAVANQAGGRLSNEMVRFIVWPYVGDTRAVQVRPRTTPTEDARAEAVMAAARRRP